jgi:hypothetical protein
MAAPPVPPKPIYEPWPHPPSTTLTKGQAEQLLRNSGHVDPRDEQIRALMEGLERTRAAFDGITKLLDGVRDLGDVQRKEIDSLNLHRGLKDTEIKYLRTALSDLVGALPKCIQCGAPAPTRDGTMYYCEAHEPSWIGGQHELPYAAPLQRCLTLLKGAG